MKSLLIGAVTAATLALPVAALAATYQYVNISGNLVTETADTDAQALAQPTDLAPHSGVMLVVPPVTSIVTVPATTDASTTTTTVTSTPSGTVTITTVPPVSTTTAAISGTYSDQLSGINTTSRTLWLTLGADGTAVLSNVYVGSTTPTTSQTGTWTTQSNGQLQVSLSGQGTLPTQTLNLTQNGMNLNATSYDSSIYGTQGLTFTR